MRQLEVFKIQMVNKRGGIFFLLINQPNRSFTGKGQSNKKYQPVSLSFCIYSVLSDTGNSC